MLEGLYDAQNEITRFETFMTVDPARKAAIAAFLRRAGLSHLYAELFEPLMSGGSLLAAGAISDRPWPPSGVGAQRIEALAFALIGEGQRAFLTPTLAAPEHATNVGLTAAVTKTLLKELEAKGVDQVVYVVHEKSSLARHILQEVGFKPTGENVVTGRAGYLHVATAPGRMLSSLGIAELRAGDLLTHRMEPSVLSRVALFEIGLARAVEGAWFDRLIEAEILPGLIDWVASPPGGIGGTPGPTGRPLPESPITRA